MGWDVDYCLSEPVEGKCSLNFSLSIIIVVIVCNVVKALVMLYIAFSIRDKPLLTVGDAVDSFLNFNELNTKEMCLASKESIQTVEIVPDSARETRYWPSDPVKYKHVFKLLRHSASVTRWRTTITLCVRCSPLHRGANPEQICLLHACCCHFSRSWNQNSQRL